MFTRTAIIHAFPTDASVLAIKRAALLFDDLRYIPPGGAFYNGTADELKRRTARNPNGTLRWEGPLDWGKDITQMARLEIRRHAYLPLSSMVATFEDSGFFKSAMTKDEAAPHVDSEPDFVRMRSLLLHVDVHDPNFLSVTQTPRDWMSHPIGVNYLELTSLDGKPRQTVAQFNAPLAWTASEMLSTMAYMCHKFNATPLAMAPDFFEAMRIRHARTAKQIQSSRNALIRKNLLLLTEDYNKTFAGGHVLFHLSGALFNDSILRVLAPEEIVGLRESWLHARRALLDDCFIQLDQIINESTDSISMTRHADEFVKQKIIPAFHEFRAEMASRNDTLTAGLVVATGEMLKNMALGGALGAGGVAATVFPNGSMLGYLVGGAALAAVATAPQYIRSICDYYIDLRESDRSAIAYLGAVYDSAGLRFG